MAKRLLVLQILLALLLGVTLPSTALAAKSDPRIDEAVLVLQEMFGQEDAVAAARLLENAKGVAIFPNVIKAGIMLGGRYGEGLVLKRDERGQWYGPHFVTVKGVSYGLQFGVQSTALVMVIANDRGMEGFTGDKVTLGGDIAVAAGPVGRQAGAGTDVDLKAAIYSYSMSKGMFAGMSLEGSVIQADTEANEEYWGSDLSPDKALAKKATDSRIKPLVAELEQLIDKAQ